MKMNHLNSKDDIIGYCEHVLKNNGFYDFELNYYMGKEPHLKPHGLDAYIWEVASNNVGFKVENLQLMGKKYHLKKNKQ
jgi:hypothetical protein